MTRRKRRNFPSTTTENGAYDSLMADPALQKGITDDAMVVERMTNEKVKLVMGDYRNIKVTTPEDMTVAAAFLDDLKKM